MASSKYANCFIKGPFTVTNGLSMGGITLGYNTITDTKYAHLEPHSHDFNMLLCFMGGNARNMKEFGAEIHVCLGEEHEEHIITSPTVISVPAGMVHCPLTVKKLTKPVVFFEIAMTTDYKANKGKPAAHAVKKK
jgi:hypothetical protein